jgi:D-sedoheptulose 7-phosphate isomerase
MNYIDRLVAALGVMNTPMYEAVIDDLVNGLYNMCHKSDGRLFVMGNGGSSAIASHFVADMMKTSRGGPTTICLSDNTPLLTALANDCGYETVFSDQLDYHSANSDDTILVISSSGNSDNIIEALRWARGNGVEAFALVGMTGGRAISHTGNWIHVRDDDYGIVEDCHHAIMHDITDRLKKMNK